MITREFGKLFSDADSLCLLFLKNGIDTEPTDSDSGLDWDVLGKFYSKLSSSSDDVKRVVRTALESVGANLKRLVAASSFFRAPFKGLRIFDVILSFPDLAEPKYHRSILVPTLEALGTLEERPRTALATWWSHAGKERLEGRLVLLHTVITMRILLPPPVESMGKDVSIVSAAKAMGVVYKANELAGKPLPFKEFYNETLNENLDVQEDFLAWIRRQGFSFILTPYLLDPSRKALVLRYESRVNQVEMGERALRTALFGGAAQFSPYLVFNVRRDHLIPDTLESIVRVGNPEDLKKELKIKFVGEEGVDAGGVQKEFFQLIVREIFNADFGMFTLDPETRRYWFSPNSTEFREFELIGTILGLAVYNGVILDVHLPNVVYKKLMRKPVDMEDLKEVSPELYRGMKTLLAFDGNVEETYARDFQVEYEYFGVKQYRDLKEGGANIPLTNANREEYVSLFVDYQLNKSVERQFAAFKKGFDLVMNGPAFAIFTVEELELVICGDPVLDFEELQKAAQYEEYLPTDNVVVWFWEVVHSLSEEEKRKLLHFATGSDRAPIGGLKNLQLVIQRHGDGDERLPSSHTCFNHLLLPLYTSKEALRTKLMMALQNSVGFGLR